MRKAQMPLATQKKIELAQKIFNTADGERFLKVLEDEFDRDNIFAPGDPYSTSYNCGRRDVVVYIKQLMRAGQDE